MSSHSQHTILFVIEDQWNRLSPMERAEKEQFVAGEKSVTRGFMRMVCMCFDHDYCTLIIITISQLSMIMINVL